MLSRLPHRVIIQTETRTEFEGGASTVSWTDASTEWANVQFSASSNETYNEDKKQQMSYLNVVMRQDITLTNKNRMIFNNKILVIENEGDPTYRKRMKIIKCRLEEGNIVDKTAWILNDDDSPIANYSYIWDDNEVWNDDNIWKD